MDPFIIDEAPNGTVGPDVHPEHPVKKQYPAAYLMVVEGTLVWVLNNKKGEAVQIQESKTKAPLVWAEPGEGRPTSVIPILATRPADMPGPMQEGQGENNNTLNTTQQTTTQQTAQVNIQAAAASQPQQAQQAEINMLSQGIKETNLVSF